MPLCWPLVKMAYLAKTRKKSRMLPAGTTMTKTWVVTRWPKQKNKVQVPDLVFVQGGTFTMGQTEEDVMSDWNNIPRRVTVPSFYMDRTEVANVHYREYIHWLNNVFDVKVIRITVRLLNAALPDTLVWRSELSYNEPLVEYYFRHPSFNYYPVVGVSWRQAHDFCLWRSDRVNEGILINKGYIANTRYSGSAAGK